MNLRYLVDVFLDPLVIVFVGALLLWVLGLSKRLKRRRKLKGFMLTTVPLFVVALVFSAPAIVNPLVRALEHPNVPVAAFCDDNALPLVVLGGGVSSVATDASQIEHMSQATFARTTRALALYQSAPDADYPIVLAGGTRRTVTESAVMQYLLTTAGVPLDRILVDAESVNTNTNAMKVGELLDEWEVSSNRQIRLVTSALHMPRAAVEFERVGFEVCRISVDYQGLSGVPWYALLPQRTAMVKADRWLHEVVGLLVVKVGALLS